MGIAGGIEAEGEWGLKRGERGEETGEFRSHNMLAIEPDIEVEFAKHGAEVAFIGPYRNPEVVESYD